MRTVAVERSSNGRNVVRNAADPSHRHLQHFFQMFLFITFVSTECTGRAFLQVAQECTRGARCLRRVPRPLHTDKQSNRPLLQRHL